MLTQMRKATRGVFAGILLALLTIAFAIWGINDVFRPISTNDVVAGKGVAVDRRIFLREFENEVRALQAQNREITKTQALEANLHRQVLERLGTQAAVERLARRAGIGVADIMVADAIRNDESFRNDLTGTFDQDKYKSVLANAGYTTEDYKNQLRSSFARRQLAQSAIAGLHAPTSFGALIHAFDMEKRVVSIAAITPARVGAPPAPMEADLDAFYKTNGQAFSLPEFRTFTIVRAAPSDFESKVTVDEAEIDALYAQQKDRMSVPEKRSFVQLSGATDQAKATDAARRLAAGEAPEAIAAALSMQVQTFTDQTANQAPDAKVASAVFNLKSAGAATGAIEGLSWSAAKLIAISPAQSGDSPAARAQARAAFIKDQAITLMNEAIEDLDTKRNAGGDVAALAQASGLRVSQSGAVEARGLTETGAPAADFLDNPGLLKRAFDMTQGEPGEFENDGEDGFVLLRLDTIRAAGPPPLNSIKPEVTLAWRAQKTGEAMRALGDQVSTSLKAGHSLADTARAQRLQVVVSNQTIDRSAAQGGTAPQMVAQLFGTPKGETAIAAGGPNGAILFVGIVHDILRPDAAAEKTAVEERRRAAVTLLSNDMLEAISRSARQSAALKLKTDMADRLVGKQADEGPPAK
jgi:peptidyl-prolyl cis-trans isomerase D